ncbi:A24 family peptidase [Halocatena salina]|uniref:Prepilin peptidase n=1 Tax=Halocatena salina TaxID=2934340 RepID=A0A8U0A2K2_9EURY|nr:A24 family peptidase [Halocatena salina]UPM43431.1 prepilin peptidase [Halocatena salina]
MFVTLPDLLRLLVVPCIAWTGYHDIQTRRIPNWIWLPLTVGGVVALLIDTSVVAGPVRTAFVLRCAVSLGVVAPIGWLCSRLGIVGGADAKAIGTLALVFPVYPTIYFRWGVLPIERASHGVFALTILTNTVLVGLVIPIVLAVYNGINGRIRPTMFVGRPYRIADVSSIYGQLLEDETGRILTGGLDLDALRMYLRWRETSLAALRAAPDTYRDPVNCSSASAGDQWGATAFLSEIEGTAYGTTPDQLRRGLEWLCTPTVESVWITPGIPFLAVVCLGLMIALTHGDVLSTVLGAFGLV